MGCNVCKNFSETKGGEVILDAAKMIEISKTKAFFANVFASDQKEMALENIFIDIGGDDGTMVFKTKKNDIRRVNKDEISERSTKIGKDFASNTSRGKSISQFDLGKFQKDILRSIEMESRNKIK